MSPQRHHGAVIVTIRLRNRQKGSLASFREPGRICASLSRISCIATLMSGAHREFDDHQAGVFTRARGDFLDPGDRVQRVSDRLGQSFSTACGLAPGYCTTVNANGRFTSGIASIGSQPDTAPITMSASMTMVRTPDF